MTDLIDVASLRMAYSTGAMVLDDMALVVGHGEVVAVTGPSGSGKSTLLYCLGGMVRPLAGSIRVAGFELVGRSDIELARYRSDHLGFVFQDAMLDPSRKVLHAVTEPAIYAATKPREHRRRALQLLERFGVASLTDRRPGQISGGQAQRVALARALLLEPDLILADEPTGNLDRASGSIVIEALRSYAAVSGAGVVIATHDADVVRQADREIVL